MFEQVGSLPESAATPGATSTTAPMGAGALVSAPRRHRRIAILGFASTVKDAPFEDPSWELWAMNGFWRTEEAKRVAPERFGLWFDMHTLEYIKTYGELAGVKGEQERWLAEPHPFPIFMLEEHPELPAVLRFPIEQIIERLGQDYFTSTVAYALTYALALPDVAEIGLWGVDLVHGTEWGDQRPCAEFWIGRAIAMGIKITIHERSALLRQRFRYGYEDQDPIVRDLRACLTEQAEGLTKAIGDHQAKLTQLTAQMHTDDGALQAVRGILDRLDIFGRGGRI